MTAACAPLDAQGAAPPASHPTVIDTRFGEVAYRAQAELHFPLGMPGFDGVDRFVLCGVPGTAGSFKLLHALTATPLDLVVVPQESLPDQVAAADIDSVRRSLGIPEADLLVLHIVTLPLAGAAQPIRVNLRAPIFVDVARQVAVQKVLSNPRYGFKAPLQAA